MRTFLFCFFIALASILLDRSGYCATSNGKSFSSGVVSQQQDEPDDAWEEDRLKRILSSYTKIATKSRLNADYVPGMVTVLYGDDLAARGVRTVVEALKLVPGMDTILFRHGFWMVGSRGPTAALAFGNVKFMIDDIPVNTEFATDPIPNMPVGQIERIDVIRGPASAIYGEFAFAGVVNIITRKNENRLFCEFGSFSKYGGGGVASVVDSASDVSLNLNMAGWRTNGPNITTGPDTLYGRGMGEISYAPGLTNEMNRYGTAFLTLKYKKFTLLGQFLTNKQGDYFGMSYALPPPSNDARFESNKYGFETRQEVDFSPRLHAQFHFGWQEQEFQTSDLHLFPDNYNIFLPNGDRIIYPQGWLIDMYYGENLISGGMTLTWNGLQNHDFMLGLAGQSRKADDVWVATNFYNGSALPLPHEKIRLNGSAIGFVEGRKREQFNIILQDMWKMSSRLELTTGARYDFYNDIENTLSPRIAAVYRFNDYHVIKAQYARAFRPPSFWEMYSANNPLGIGNPDLESETNNTFELSYIYTDYVSVLRTTLFYSITDNIIYVENGKQVNSGEHSYRGLEMEIERHLLRSLRLDGNISYLQANDADTVSQGAQAPMWRGSLALKYQPNSMMQLVGQYYYTGRRGRETFDPRAKMDACRTLDMTLSLFDVGINGLLFRAGIKNIFASDVRQPAPLEEFDPYGNRYPSYPDDFPRPGRTWWCQLSYAF